MKLAFIYLFRTTNMSYYHKPKYHSQKVEETFEMSIFTESKIFKNDSYRKDRCPIIGLEIAGDQHITYLVDLTHCIRKNKEGTRFYSYEPYFMESHFKFFKEGFFNATEEEKIMFGLTFNNFGAYDMCLEAFNEAEEFFASHCR